jgi:predicted lysophospholipase L1 biosynthesis ABC-type transport system permease subunit
VTPTRRQRLRPLELVVMAALVAVFVGVVVLVTTRDLSLAAIFAGVAFIAALLVLAMLALVETSDPTDPSDGPVLMRERKRRDRKD